MISYVLTGTGLGCSFHTFVDFKLLLLVFNLWTLYLWRLPAKVKYIFTGIETHSCFSWTQQFLHMVVIREKESGRIRCWLTVVAVQMSGKGGCCRGELLLCGQDHFTRRNAATCSGLWKQSWRWPAGNSPATKRGSPRWHRRDTFRSFQRFLGAPEECEKAEWWISTPFWIPEAHWELDDTNNSVQPYFITMQLKTFMWWGQQMPLGMWLLGAFEGNFSTLCSILRCWVPVWSSRLHKQRKKEFKVEIPACLLRLPDAPETYGKCGFWLRIISAACDPHVMKELYLL